LDDEEGDMWPFDKRKDEASKAMPAYRLECGLDTGDGNTVPVLPMLMRKDWARKPTQLCRPLITKVELPHIPWVALVHLIDEGGSTAPSRVYLRSERAEQIGKSVAEFEAEALHNIAVRPASWQVTSPTDAKLALCTNDYLAAEHCLSPNFIREAGRLLGTRSLMVGIPSRGHLLATPLEHFTSGAGADL
jgi:hypothetical protein